MDIKVALLNTAKNFISQLNTRVGKSQMQPFLPPLNLPMAIA